MGCAVAGVVFDADELVVLAVGEPAAAVFEDVEIALGAELDVDDLGRLIVRQEPLHRHIVAIFVHRDHHDPPAGQVGGDPFSLEIVRERALGAGEVGRPVDGAAGGRAAAGADIREALGDAVGVGDKGRLRWRKLLQARIIDRGVGRLHRILRRQRRVRHEVVKRKRVILADEVRPAEVSGAFGLVHLVVPAGADFGVGRGIGANLAPVDVAGLAIDGHPPGVPVPHGVDFGARIRGAGGKQVAFGDRVGAVVFRVDADDLTAEVVRVAGAALVVPAAAARALIGLRLEGIRGVVADRHEQVAGRIPRHPAARVAAGLALDGVFEHDFFCTIHERAVAVVPSRQHVLGFGGVRIEQEDPRFLVEVWMHSHPHQPFFRLADHTFCAGVFGIDRDRRDRRHRVADRVVAFDAAFPFDEKDRAVVEDFERHRLVHRSALRQHHGREAVVIGPLGGGGAGWG